MYTCENRPQISNTESKLSEIIGLENKKSISINIQKKNSNY